MWVVDVDGRLINIELFHGLTIAAKVDPGLLWDVKAYILEPNSSGAYLITSTALYCSDDKSACEDILQYIAQCIKAGAHPCNPVDRSAMFEVHYNVQER